MRAGCRLFWQFPALLVCFRHQDALVPPSLLVGEGDQGDTTRVDFSARPSVASPVLSNEDALTPLSPLAGEGGEGDERDKSVRMR